MARFDFNTAEYDDFEGGGSFEPIPEGEYEMMCEEAEDKETKSGGTMIKAKFRVLGPTHSNRVIFSNFNVVNRSEKAQEIGRRQIATWARAVGLPNASDTDQLLNRPFIGVVDIEAGDDKYGPQNRIQGFKPKGGGAAPAPKPVTPKPATKEPATEPETSATAESKPAVPPPSKPVTPSGKKAPWDD